VQDHQNTSAEAVQALLVVGVMILQVAAAASEASVANIFGIIIAVIVYVRVTVLLGTLQYIIRQH
tara:strand:- start:187 stop:381 length:195 start_codon:yes stop_codon:yes gene_type:complete